MMDPMIQQHTSDERVWAGLAYLLGLIPALIIWVTKKDDLPNAGFHAMQAVIFDGINSIIAIVMLAVTLLMMIIFQASAFFATNIIADAIQPESPLVFLMISMLLILILIGGVGLMAVLLAGIKLVDLIIALGAFAGKNWHLPVISTWAENINQRYLMKSQRKKE
jgi:uncharacterized membrane protein